MRLLRPFRSRPRHTVVLYSKPGCHLCDDIRALLARLARRYDLSIEEVDITSDPALFRKYDIVIPVLLIDGQELEAPIAENQVRKALRSAEQR